MRGAGRRGRRRAAAGLAALGLAAACATTPATRFYVLEAAAEPRDAPGADVTVGVGPVAVPSYLDRPQIVTRAGDHELRVADLHQWGETLEEGVTRVLASNLAARLGTERVDVYPWERSRRIDVQMTLDVVRFERTPAGDVLLDAHWRLLRPRGGEVLLSRRSAHRATAAGTDYARTVAAMSEALRSLSREIATAIQEQQEGGRS